MGNSQNMSDIKYLEKSLQFETISSSMAQFVDKWQRNKVQPSQVFWPKQWFFSIIEHSSLIPCKLFFSKPKLLVENRQNWFKSSFRNFFQNWIIILEAEIRPFLRWLFAGYSLYNPWTVMLTVKTSRFGHVLFVGHIPYWSLFKWTEIIKWTYSR